MGGEGEDLNAWAKRAEGDGTPGIFSALSGWPSGTR